MKPSILLGIIAFNTTILAGVISFLISLGVPLLIALSGIFLFAVFVMLMMIKSAARLYDDDELAVQGSRAKDQINSEIATNNQIENVEAGVTVRSSLGHAA